MYETLIEFLISTGFSVAIGILIQWLANATDGYAKYQKLVEKNQMDAMLKKWYHVADEMKKEFKSYDDEVQKYIK